VEQEETKGEAEDITISEIENPAATETGTEVDTEAQVTYD